MNERMTSLLFEASKCFGDLSSPFTTEWLGEHHVTLDECGDLSEAIASAIKLYIYLPSDERMFFELKRAIGEADLPEEIKRTMYASLNFNQSLKRLRKAEAKS